MSDQKGRERELLWRKTGSSSDEAAYVAQRVREGALSPEQLLFEAVTEGGAAALALSDRLTMIDHKEARALQRTWTRAFAPRGAAARDWVGLLIGAQASSSFDETNSVTHGARAERAFVEQSPSLIVVLPGETDQLTAFSWRDPQLTALRHWPAGRICVFPSDLAWTFVSRSRYGTAPALFLSRRADD